MSLILMASISWGVLARPSLLQMIANYCLVTQFSQVAASQYEATGESSLGEFGCYTFMYKLYYSSISELALWT